VSAWGGGGWSLGGEFEADDIAGGIAAEETAVSEDWGGPAAAAEDLSGGDGFEGIRGDWGDG
jgi:hypothetical protein